MAFESLLPNFAAQQFNGVSVPGDFAAMDHEQMGHAPIKTEGFNAEASGYAALMMGVGAGALFGALIIASQGAQLPRGALLRVSSIGFGMVIVAFAISRSVVFSGTMLFLTGIAMMSNNAVINGLLQHRVPDRLRGRVMAIYVTVYVGINPLGSLFEREDGGGRV
jgi:MFS family permease